MQHFTVSLRMTLVVVHIPAERVEERIGKILPELGFVILLLPAEIGITVECVLVD